ncbi:MAG: glycosyltransferase family 4 protein [Candidatus Latescibacteria bacterium]|nr:glycosyltransferase family 4 protein [Candidatus Latescibacterota bacterium]
MELCYVGDAGSIHVQRWAWFFVERGHEVSIITDTPGEVEGCRVERIGECLTSIRIPVVSAALQILGKVQAIRRLLEEIKPDIVHGHYVTNYGFLAAMSGYHPLVQTVHGSDLLVDVARSFEKRFFVRYALRKADLITSAAKHMTERVAVLGIDWKKVVTFQYGIDVDRFALPVDANQRNPMRVISTRAFDWKYQLDTLIRAIPHVVKETPEAEFFLIGDGPDRDRLLQMIEDLGVGWAVQLPGRVYSQDMIGLLQSGTVYVSTSVTDGASLSLLEAMGCGLFPVVTDIEANREWITDGENGWLFPVGASEKLALKILQVLRDSSLRQRAIGVNRQLVEEKASYRKNMEMMERLYEQLVQGV